VWGYGLDRAGSG